MKSKRALIAASIIWLALIAFSVTAAHFLPPVLLSGLAAFKLYEWTADAVILGLRTTRERYEAR